MKISCTAKARLLWKETSKIYQTSLKTNYFFSQTEESLLALSIMDKLYGFDFCSDTPKYLIIKSPSLLHLDFLNLPHLKL